VHRIRRSRTCDGLIRKRLLKFYFFAKMKDIDGRREYIGQREYHSRSFGHRSTHLQATVFSYRPKYSSTFLSLCHKPWTLISHLLLSIPIFFPAIGAILLGWFSLVELASLPMFTTSVMLYIGRSTHRTPPSTCATCFFLRNALLSSSPHATSSFAAPLHSPHAGTGAPCSSALHPRARRRAPCRLCSLPPSFPRTTVPSTHLPLPLRSRSCTPPENEDDGAGSNKVGAIGIWI